MLSWDLLKDIFVLKFQLDFFIIIDLKKKKKSLPFLVLGLPTDKSVVNAHSNI